MANEFTAVFERAVSEVRCPNGAAESSYRAEESSPRRTAASRSDGTLTRCVSRVADLGTYDNGEGCAAGSRRCDGDGEGCKGDDSYFGAGAGFDKKFGGCGDVEQGKA